MNKVVARRDETGQSPSLGLRLTLGFLFWLLLALSAAPTFALLLPSWRIPVVVAAVAPAYYFAWQVKLPAPSMEAKPVVDFSPDLMTNLLTNSLDRADRVHTAWMAILGTVHSAAIAAVIGLGGGSLFTPQAMPLTGLGLLLLGVTCFAAGHAMEGANEAATRTIEVAAAHPKLSTYVRYTFPQGDWKDTVMASAVAQLARVWLSIGGLALVASTLLVLLGLLR